MYTEVLPSNGPLGLERAQWAQRRHLPPPAVISDVISIEPAEVTFFGKRFLAAVA